MFQAKVIRVGGDSIGIVLPFQIAKAKKIKLGDQVIIIDVEKTKNNNNHLKKAA